MAKDGAELPAAQATEGPAEIRLDVGETGDVEWTTAVDGALAEAQFQPGGTVVYRGAALDGVGRWRP